MQIPPNASDSPGTALASQVVAGRACCQALEHVGWLGCCLAEICKALSPHRGRGHTGPAGQPGAEWTNRCQLWEGWVSKTRSAVGSHDPLSPQHSGSVQGASPAPWGRDKQ